MAKFPKWLETAVFYEIYPQSFNDTNIDGIGDLQGIIEKLDYICELGCNAIWINPCFESPFADAGYDVSNYKKIAPRYGNNSDMRQLISKAHERGIHVLLDLVPGHTSIEHPWFIESMKTNKNEYSDRYIWTNSIWENPEGLSCIRGISDRDGSAGVNFFSSQPALNYGYANPDPSKPYQMKPTDEAPMATRQAIKDVMAYWLDMGCDGFRVDMAGSLVKNDTDGTENIKLWQDFREFLDNNYPDCAMVSEWGEPEKSIAGGFHMDFLLHFGPECYTSLFRSKKPFFSKSGGDISIFKEQFQKYYNSSKGKGLICIPSGNHDMDRLARNHDIDELKVCFAFLLTMCGAPFIYYGDEIGMNYIENLTSVEGGYGRTGSRSPMQWNNSENAGFSDYIKPHIDLDVSQNRRNVENERGNLNSLLNNIITLNKIRKKYSALQNTSGFEFVYAEKDKYPLVYKRFDEKQNIYIFINPIEEQSVCNLNSKLEGNIIYSTGGEVSFSKKDVICPPCSASIFLCDK